MLLITFTDECAKATQADVYRFLTTKMLDVNKIVSLNIPGLIVIEPRNSGTPLYDCAKLGEEAADYAVGRRTQDEVDRVPAVYAGKVRTNDTEFINAIYDELTNGAFLPPEGRHGCRIVTANYQNLPGVYVIRFYSQ